jgi:hypothetical protein
MIKSRLLLLLIGDLSYSMVSSINNNISSTAYALHCLEGLCITLMCQLSLQIKRMAISLLNEAKFLLEILLPNVSFEFLAFNQSINLAT